MNIIVAHNNYAETSSIENDTAVSFYTLPETAQQRMGRPVFLPDYANPARVALHIGLHICRLGRCISERFAYRYFDTATVVPHFFASTILETAIEERTPITPAVGFDNAIAIGEFLPVSAESLSGIEFSMAVDRLSVLSGRASALKKSATEMIALVSRYLTLRTGDILLLGAPDRTVELSPEHHVETFLSDKRVLSFRVK